MLAIVQCWINVLYNPVIDLEEMTGSPYLFIFKEEIKQKWLAISKSRHRYLNINNGVGISIDISI